MRMVKQGKKYWGFIGIWCLEFDISEVLNTRDSVS